MIGKPYIKYTPARLTWLDCELKSILETAQNAIVNADAMLRTLAEIRSLPEIKGGVMKRIKSKWGSKTALTNQIKCAPATTSPVAAAMRKAAGV